MAETENSSVWTFRRQESDALEVYLLGVVDFDSAMFLQDRLHREIAQRQDGLGALLICEHPSMVTVGREGSLLDLPDDSHEFEARLIQIKRVARGGGTLLHAPGQVVAYPILPVERDRFQAGRPAGHAASRSQCQPALRDAEADLPEGRGGIFQFVRKCTTAVCDLALEFQVNASVTADGTGVASRCGQFGWVGATIRDGVSLHGLFVNVTPDLEPFGLINAPRPASSLSMQKMRPVAMSKVRESLIRNLSSQFGYEDMHLYTRHPLLTRKVVEYA